MRKILLLIIILLFTILSGTTYLVLSKEIITGNLKIAAGQKQLAEGELLLAKGKIKLADGESRLEHAKRTYQHVKSIPLMGIASRLPITSEIIGIPEHKIARGDELVEKGKEKIKAGEEQLAEGRSDLDRGIKKLKEANEIRIACGITSLILALIFVFLCYYWRKFLQRLKTPLN